MRSQERLTFTSIGIVRSPYASSADAPRQGRFRPEVVSTIELHAGLEEALTHIESFSHIIVLYAFDRSVGWEPLVRTPWDETRHGVFATRSPRRPNPIGLTVVELVRRAGTALRVKGLDALDGSMVLDLKPYIPPVDSIAAANRGWLGDDIENAARD
jgi:tRNA-Thr(GGU) m(6)t(6)A37 methyltransferase TsaA